MYACFSFSGTVSVRSCNISLILAGVGEGGRCVGPLAIAAATVASLICIAPSAKIVSICPKVVPRGITMSVGPQFTTGIVVLLLKFVWISAGPPQRSGNWEEKILAIAVAPAADALWCEGVQLSVIARLPWAGILNCLSVCKEATTPAEVLNTV
jgi:hypothetical protein